VEQSAKPFFYVTLFEHRQEYLLGVQKAMEQTAKEVAAKVNSLPSQRLAA